MGTPLPEVFLILNSAQQERKPMGTIICLAHFLDRVPSVRQ
jgi:hypothetical protein